MTATQQVSVGIGTTLSATATCPAGKSVVGGGFYVTDSGGGILGTSYAWDIIQNAPTSGGAWTAQIRVTGLPFLGSGPIKLTTYAICI